MINKERKISVSTVELYMERKKKKKKKYYKSLNDKFRF